MATRDPNLKKQIAALVRTRDEIERCIAGFEANLYPGAPESAALRTELGAELFAMAAELGVERPQQEEGAPRALSDLARRPEPPAPPPLSAEEAYANDEVPSPVMKLLEKQGIR